jgi:hypothetical protein
MVFVLVLALALLALVGVIGTILAMRDSPRRVPAIGDYDTRRPLP